MRKHCGLATVLAVALAVTIPARAADSPRSTTQPAAKPTTMPTDLGKGFDSPKAVLEALQQAGEKGDVEAFARTLTPRLQPGMLRIAKAQKPFEPKVKQLAALLEKIDPLNALIFAKVVLPVTARQPLAEVMRDGKVNWDKVKIETNGNTAKYGLVDESGKLHTQDQMVFAKVGGKWFGALGDDDDERAEISAQMTKMAERMEANATKINESLAKLDADLHAGKVTKDNFRESVAGVVDSVRGSGPASPGPGGS